MIEPSEVYHWLGRDAYEAVLESYELVPEACSHGPVIEMDQDIE